MLRVNEKLESEALELISLLISTINDNNTDDIHQIFNINYNSDSGNNLIEKTVSVSLSPLFYFIFSFNISPTLFINSISTPQNPVTKISLANNNHNNRIKNKTLINYQLKKCREVGSNPPAYHTLTILAQLISISLTHPELIFHTLLNSNINNNSNSNSSSSSSSIDSINNSEKSNAREESSTSNQNNNNNTNTTNSNLSSTSPDSDMLYRMCLSNVLLLSLLDTHNDFFNALFSAGDAHTQSIVNRNVCVAMLVAPLHPTQPHIPRSTHTLFFLLSLLSYAPFSRLSQINSPLIHAVIDAQPHSDHRKSSSDDSSYAINSLLTRNSTGRTISAYSLLLEQLEEEDFNSLLLLFHTHLLSNNDDDDNNNPIARNIYNVIKNNLFDINNIHTVRNVFSFITDEFEEFEDEADFH